MIWAGSPFAHRIEFSAGSPTGAVSFSLLGNDNSVLVSDTVTPDTGAVDCLIVIDGENNSCDTDLLEQRTLTWSYLTASGAHSGRLTYMVCQPIPFAVSCDGVRNKLGIEANELGDAAIDLVSAYAEFASLIEATTLSDAAVAGTRTTLLCVHAIEAVAGLALLPTLQMRAAQQESSGTDSFARFGKIDWQLLEGSLLSYVARARTELDGAFDELGTAGFVFGTAPRETDAITGETN